MKKYKYIAGCLTLSLSLTMTSCDNFLDVDLDNQMQMDEVFAKRNTLERYFAHIYSFVYQPYDFHGNAIGACVPMSDEATFSWLSGLGYHSFLIGNWSVATGDYAMWKQMYTGINQATVFLDNADQCNDETLSRQEIEVMKADLAAIVPSAFGRTLRALATDIENLFMSLFGLAEEEKAAILAELKASLSSSSCQ